MSKKLFQNMDSKPSQTKDSVRKLSYLYKQTDLEKMQQSKAGLADLI